MFDDIGSRPYEYGEILAKSFKSVFGKRFLDYFLPALIVLVAYGILAIIIEPEMKRSMLDAVGTTASQFDRRLMTGYLSVWGKYFVFYLLLFLLYIFCIVYVLLRRRQAILGQAAPIRQTLREAVHPARYLGLLLTCIVSGILIGIGLLFCVLPGFVVMILLSLAPVCAVFSEKRFDVPIGRAARLISGRVGLTFGLILTLVAVFIVLEILLFLPMMSQMRLPTPGSNPPDPQVFLRDQLEMASSPRMWALTGVFSVLCALAYLVSGFTTVIMYFNYKLVPVKKGAGPAPAEESPRPAPPAA